jgi:hypothetical protein
MCNDLDFVLRPILPAIETAAYSTTPNSGVSVWFEVGTINTVEGYQWMKRADHPDLRR